MQNVSTHVFSPPWITLCFYRRYGGGMSAAKAALESDTRVIPRLFMVDLDNILML